MPDKVFLPGDHWAILRDPMDISEREARQLQRRYAEFSRKLRGNSKSTGPLRMTDERLAAAADFEHEVLASFIESWDFTPSPSADALMDLPRPVYNALDEAAEPLMSVIIPGLAKKDEPQDDDEED